MTQKSMGVLTHGNGQEATGELGDLGQGLGLEGVGEKYSNVDITKHSSHSQPFSVIASISSHFYPFPTIIAIPSYFQPLPAISGRFR